MLNFISYLYLLAGPVLMFIGTAFLAPKFEGDRLNLRQHYYSARPIYSTVLVLTWAWAIFTAPVFRGYFVEHSPLFAMFLVVALAQRLTDNGTVHRVAAVLNSLLFVAFVSIFGLELGVLAPKFDLFD